MNEKNSIGINKCFGEINNPIDLFKMWYEEAKKTEINDPNAVALATSSEEAVPAVRMVLLKSYNDNGFVFYTNLESNKSKDININPNAAMCFHWKSLLRQIRIVGKVNQVSAKEADEYYDSRGYGSRIGAWASNQSKILNSREQLYESIESFKKKFPNNSKVPRPPYWSGWNLKPNKIEFWLDGESRVHERLLYELKHNGKWTKKLLSP